MSIKLKTINKEKVSVVKKAKEDNRPVLGANISPVCYTNIALIAPTAGGKSTCIYNILKRCAGKKTKIVAFVSTILNDETWISIKKYFKANKIEFVGHNSIFENGKNILEEYMEEFREKAKEREKAEDNKFVTISVEESLANKCLFFDSDSEDEEEKSKYQYPKHIFVFDDLSQELHTTQYQTFLKSARHWHVTTITGTQDLYDLRGSGVRNQIRIWILFKNLNEARLKNLYETIAPNIPLDKFEAMYKFAVSKPYSFFYISPRTFEFRQNFDKEFIV